MGIIYATTSLMISFLSDILSMYASLFTSMKVGLGLFRSNQKALRARSKFHILWDLLEPMVIALVFIVLFEFRALPVETGQIPYALFVVTGILIWQSLSESITGILGIIPRSAAMLSHTKLTPEALIWSALFQLAYSSAFRFVIVCFALVGFGVIQPLGMLLGAVFWAGACILFFGIGLLLAPFNAILPDVNRFTSIILRPLLYISGVIFPLPATAFFNWVSTFNPFNVFINAFRSLVTGAEDFWSNELFCFAFLFFALLHFAWYVFNKGLLIVVART